MSHATLRHKRQITLPVEISDELHVREGDAVEFTVAEPGVVAMRGMRMIPVDQAWFWTEEWQAGERQADEDIAAGRTTFFGSTDEFLAALDEMMQ
jgi:antitoxin PrlF